MKIFLSISFTFLIILSGMHLSYSRHLCGGEVKSTHWSFLGEEASCEMEVTKTACPEHHTISSECCDNEMQTFSMDDNYKTSFQINDESRQLLQVYLIPFRIALFSLHPVNSTNSGVAPPDTPLTSAVSLENICIFRI